MSHWGPKLTDKEVKIAKEISTNTKNMPITKGRSRKLHTFFAKVWWRSIFHWSSQTCSRISRLFSWSWSWTPGPHRIHEITCSALQINRGPIKPLGPLDALRSPAVPYKSSENPSNVAVDSMGHLGNFPLTPWDTTGIPLDLRDPKDVLLATWNTPDVPLDPLGRPWTWTRGQLKTRDVA